MELKDIRVFVCVPGLGKTHLAERDSRFLDMDALKGEYKYGLSKADKAAFEANKGNRQTVVHEDANKYIEDLFIKMYNTTDKLFLFAPNPAMVEMINAHNIPYCLVYHAKDPQTLEDIRQRMKARGNQDNFIDSMTNPEIVERFYEENSTDTRPAFKIELTKGEYLADKILPLLEPNPQSTL